MEFLKTMIAGLFGLCCIALLSLLIFGITYYAPYAIIGFLVIPLVYVLGASIRAEMD